MSKALHRERGLRDSMRVRLFQVAYKMSDQHDPHRRLAEALIRSSEHFVRITPEQQQAWAKLSRHGKRQRKDLSKEQTH